MMDKLVNRFTVLLGLLLAISGIGLCWSPAIAQEHVPDANTSLLLHFNGSLTGAQGENPTQAQGTSYAAGVFQQGVNLPAGNLLSYASSGNILASVGTVEFWIQPSWNGGDGQGHLVLVWDSWGGILMGKDGGNYWRIIVNRYGPGGNPERGAGFYVGSEWQAGVWHHCAFTWSSTKVQVFVDGTLRAEEPVGFALPGIDATSFQIGGEGSGNSAQAVIDEFRISNSVRSPEAIFDSYARGITFTALEVSPDPFRVTEGWSASPDVVATRAGGERVDVPPSLCAWTVADTTIAWIDAAGSVHGRRQGTTSATCVWHGLTDPFSILVEAAIPPPANVRAEGFRTTTRIQWDAVSDPGIAGYEVQRRTGAGEFETVDRVLARTSFTDDHLTPGQRYEYRVAGIGANGSPRTLFSAICPVTPDLSVEEVSTHARMEILFAFYIQGYTTADVSRMTAGIEKAMEFYWRTSGCRLAFDPTWLLIDAPLPAPEWGTAVENDLRDRGVMNDQYDLAYLIGDGLAGCFGGYLVLGSTCASLGTVCGVPYPENITGVDYTIAWTFTHEIHHAFELMENITGEATPEVLFCHFPWCYPDPLGPSGWHMDWGSHYDGIALTNRDYGAAWSLYPAPYDGVLECRDADQDGFPDSDDRVLRDEARFGSSGASGDTDGDFLDDRAEYCRYNFRGTNPVNPDTDADGLRDGVDAEPLYRTAEILPTFATPPAIDGTIEGSWRQLAPGYYFTQNGTPFTLKTYAGWTSNGLYLAFESTRKLRFMVSIDGSGQDGRFESPVRHVEGDTDTNNSDNKHNHIGDTWGDGNHIYFAHGVNTVEVWGRSAIPGAQVASSLTGGVYKTEVRIPASLPGGAAYTWYPEGDGTPVVQGLTLEPGHVIGLNVTMSNFDGSDGNEFSGTWTSLFESHSYVDFALSAVTGASDAPQAARSPGFHLANPYRPGTEIRLRVADARSADVALFDVLGRKVRTLQGSMQPGAGDRVAGEAFLSWDGRDDAGREVGSGVYYLRAKCAEGSYRRAIVLLRD